MSRPIARHADGSDCYTVGCSLGTHIAIDAEREAFVAEAMEAQPQTRSWLTPEEIKQQREAEKQAEFKQEWKERIRGWKELGFQYPVSIRRYDYWTKYSVAGDKEVAHLTERQRKALTFYTTDNFHWINAHLYKHGEPLPSGEARPFEDYDFSGSKFSHLEKNPTRELAEEIIPTLDEALAEKRAEKRVVYRGLNRKGITGLTGTWPKEDADLHAYVDENFALGSEVKMDGYVSTSPSPKAALRYATNLVPGSLKVRQEGIFFELLTRSGVNVSGISTHTDEAETLLPRGTRWKVAAVHKSKKLRHQENATGERSRFDRPSETTVTLIQLVEIED